MHSPHSLRASLTTLTAVLGIAVALVGWPLASHVTWRSGQPALHFLPAFFLGLLVVILLGGLFRAAQAAHQNGGWRWCLTQKAFGLYLTTLALVASVVVLFYSLELWRGKRAYARIARTAQQLGEPLDLRSLKPHLVPNEQNFAQSPSLLALHSLPDDFDSAAETFNTATLGPLDEMARRGLDFIRRPEPSVPWMLGQFHKPDTGGSTPEPEPGSAERILEALTPFRELLNEVAQTSRRPACLFPWSNVNPLFSDRVAYTDKVLLGLVLTFEQRGLAELRTGQSTTAFEDLQTSLRLASHLHRQPALFYARPRAHATALLLQPLWEGLSELAWATPQLERLQEQLQSIDLLTQLPGQIQLQTLTLTDLVESIIPTGPTRATGLPWTDSDRSKLAWVRFFYPRGWSLQDQAALHALHFRVLDSINGHPGRPTEPERSLSRQLMRDSSDPLFPVFLVPKAVQMARDNHEFLLFGQTVLNLARTAVALERYRLTEGSYPDDPANLVPRFMTTLPSDPLTATPLRYRRDTANAYRLYSVGMDDQDDGGTLPPPPQLGGPRPSPSGWDWVWLMDRTGADHE